MSSYYQAKRQTNLFDPKSTAPFRLSRSKIDLFLNCPRCFYLDRRLGVGQPPGYPFTLNSAVDKLLKKEFDSYRRAGTPHPLMLRDGIQALPFVHPKLDSWRDTYVGVQSHHTPSNFLVTGAVDDVWQNSAGELIVVDYKATSKNGPVSLDADWQIGYKRQMEMYQWLLRENDFPVAKTGYFVYCNGNAEKAAFNSTLEFSISILPYDGDDSWIPETLAAIRACLSQELVPKSAASCDFCAYRAAAREVEAGQLSPPKSPKSLKQFAPTVSSLSLFSLDKE